MSGHVFVCVRGIDFAIFYDFFYWVLEMFGQCGILCFSFYLHNEGEGLYRYMSSLNYNVFSIYCILCIMCLMKDYRYSF